MSRSASDAVIRAQAAAWLARLCSDERTPLDDSGFRAWLREDPRHQKAFDLVNTAWEIARGDLVNMPAGKMLRRRKRERERYVLAGALAAALAVAVGLAAMLPRPDTFTTKLGEQRRIALADGSTMLLDTATSVQVTLKRHRREITLIKGRAHFEVAHDETRPFVVSVGRQQVTAVGTAFDVGLTSDQASVLLTQGKVLVTDPTGRRTMTPGDRIVFSAGRAVADRPDLESQSAWEDGRTVFENRPLKDVVAEMNRYSRRHLVIGDAAVGDMRLSGTYRLGDAEAFATSASGLLPIEARSRSDEIILLAKAAPTEP